MYTCRCIFGIQSFGTHCRKSGKGANKKMSIKVEIVQNSKFGLFGISILVGCLGCWVGGSFFYVFTFYMFQIILILFYMCFLWGKMNFLHGSPPPLPPNINGKFRQNV